MGKIVFDISMSLDGYITADRQTPDEPLGHGGERLHDWFFHPDGKNAGVVAEGLSGVGAMIAGRRTYDDSLRWWEADGPTGPARMPLVVLTHEPPAESPRDGVYRFATDVAGAARLAREIAGDGDVVLMGGADVARQFLDAGLLDEIGIHLVPVVFGGGTRLFGSGTTEQWSLEPIGIVDTPAATHLRYRVVGTTAPEA